MTIVKTFENGQTLSVREYMEVLNYGTSLASLYAIGWQTQEGKIDHLAETFNISKDQASQEIEAWQKGTR